MRIVERKSSSGRERFDFACELKFVQDEERPGFVEGYGAVFNSLDRVGDIIVPGAFKSSIADWKKAGSMPPMVRLPYTAVYDASEACSLKITRAVA